MTGAAVGLDFSPMVPWWVIGTLAAVGFALVIYTASLRGRGALWRSMALFVLLAALANPYLITEDRDPRRCPVLLLNSKANPLTAEATGRSGLQKI